MVVVLAFVGQALDVATIPHNSRCILSGRRQRTWVVIMQPFAREKINGDTIQSLLEEATQQFPSPVMVQIEDKPVVIMEYNVWKERVLQRQHRE